jgi:signal peptidase II
MTSPSTYRLMAFIKNNLILFLLSVSIIVVERIVKFYITENLRLGESIPVMGNFLMITRSENFGAAFGILQGQNWVFIGASILVVLLVLYYYNEIIYDDLLVFASAFILAGTVGNMMDRLFFQHVIDYIDFSFWPTFNISDASLTVGVALLMIYMYLWQKEPQTKESTYAHY